MTFTVTRKYLVGPSIVAPPGPLMRPSGRLLVDPTNQPVLLVGDAAWCLFMNLSLVDAAAYCADRQAKGFNAVLCDAIATDAVGARADGSTYDGLLPFTGTVDGTHYDLTLPAAAYWARIDAMLTLCAAYGLTAILNVFDNDSFLSTYQANGNAKCRAWGQFLGNRYKDQANVLWLVGNDFQTWRATASDVTLAQNVQLGIHDFDATHGQAIELDYLISGTSESATLAALASVGAAYSYYPAYAAVLAEYNAIAKPVILEETFYDGLSSTITVPNLTDRKTLRHQAWWAFAAGAVGYIYGTNFYDFHGSWPSGINPASVGDVVTWAAFVRSFSNWSALVPDQANTFVTAGKGTAVNGRFTGSVVGPPPYKTGDGNAQTDAYVTAALTPDGTLGIAYCPFSATITVDLSKLSGTVTARWFDTTNGTYTTDAASPLSNSGTHNFSQPGNNSLGDQDWLLVLTATTALLEEVYFDWTAIGGATSYTLQVGSASGLSDLFNQDVGNVLTYMLNMPPGRHYYRIVDHPAGGVSPEVVSTP